MRSAREWFESMIEMVGERIARWILSIRWGGDKPLPYENMAQRLQGRIPSP